MFRSMSMFVAVALMAACGTDPEAIPADPFVIPLEKTSLDSELSASLIEANPAPPAKGINTWRLALSDADGNPIEDLSFRVVLFMPKHGHGSSPTTVTSTDVAGEYLVSRINFTMGGVWEVRLQADDAGADHDVLFYVSVPD